MPCAELAKLFTACGVSRCGLIVEGQFWQAGRPTLRRTCPTNRRRGGCEKLVFECPKLTYAGLARPFRFQPQIMLAWSLSPLGPHQPVSRLMWPV